MSTMVMNSRQTALMNVLLVEDNAVDARLISSMIQAPSATLHCRHVTSLAEALGHLSCDPLDVILLGAEPRRQFRI